MNIGAGALHGLVARSCTDIHARSMAAAKVPRAATLIRVGTRDPRVTSLV